MVLLDFLFQDLTWKLQSRCWLGLHLHFKSCVGWSIRIWAYLVVGHNSTEGGTKGFSYLLNVGQRPPSGPCNVPSSIRQLLTWQVASSQLEREIVFQQDGHYSLCSSHAHIIIYMSLPLPRVSQTWKFEDTVPKTIFLSYTTVSLVGFPKTPSHLIIC